MYARLFLGGSFIMRNFSKLAIIVSNKGSDSSEFSDPIVKMSNGSNSVQCADFESALEMLPPGSCVQVIANGSVGNRVVHKLSRIIREAYVFVALDLSQVAELSRVSNNPFEENQNLLEIHFPKNLASINPMGFANCKNLTRVTIPSSCKKIGINAFAGCEKLEALTFEDSENWKIIVNENEFQEVKDLNNPNENPSKFIRADSIYYGQQLEKVTLY